MCLGQGQSAGANRPNMTRQKETPIFEIRSSEAGLRCTVPGWARRGEQWYTIPLPSSPRAKKQKICLIARARTSSFGWLNADLGREGHRAPRQTKIENPDPASSDAVVASLPTFLGVPLGLISLITLTCQNSALTIVLHYGSISFTIAFYNNLRLSPSSRAASAYAPISSQEETFLEESESKESSERRDAPDQPRHELWMISRIIYSVRQTALDVFSSDCWRLLIPACLYVDTHCGNLKILTTALFSVILLRKRLSARKWLALSLLATGVGVVQLQTSAAKEVASGAVGDAHLKHLDGLVAVGAACMTSGLAGVYFELVLKGSQVDLSVQLSSGASPTLPPGNESRPLFAYFGLDNIMKGFATSLPIILSFIAGMILFDFHVTPAFLVGTCLVVGATYLYNQPESQPRAGDSSAAAAFPLALISARSHGPQKPIVV
ncbi:BQ5605_C015g07876 [Microbotryum silenes-dioicae]|uniref:BQ5605_C015g07876 protein n=1 Tax=Microbotryum silenes-dioicae TaxID=796604 RepID=A0A2X0NXF9_9BASI|nr:BQ5605_C015g07876 [Microbotryum silenes-dioicae]